MAIGENIRKLRHDAKLSQGKLADKLHVTPQAISRWENGSAEPDIETMTELARIFDVTLDYLIHGEGDPVRSDPKTDKAYHLICLIGSPVMTLFAIFFIVTTIISGEIRALDMVYAAISLAFLVSVLVLEIRHKTMKKNQRHSKKEKEN